MFSFPGVIVNESLTYLTVVLDRSASMNNVRQATIDGFNELVKGQAAKPGECLVTLAQFDHEYIPMYKDVPANLVRPLTFETYLPRGSTALLDAIGFTIESLGARLAALPETQRPANVIVVIQTDGEENTSKDYNRKRVFDMVSHQTSVYKWQFIFMGAGPDAIRDANQMGFQAGASLQYTSSPLHSAHAYRALNNAVSITRSVGSNATAGTTTDLFGGAEARSKALDETP